MLCGICMPHLPICQSWKRADCVTVVRMAYSPMEMIGRFLSRERTVSSFIPQGLHGHLLRHIEAYSPNSGGVTLAGWLFPKYLILCIHRTEDAPSSCLLEVLLLNLEKKTLSLIGSCSGCTFEATATIINEEVMTTRWLAEVGFDLINWSNENADLRMIHISSSALCLYQHIGGWVGLNCERLRNSLSFTSPWKSSSQPDSLATDLREMNGHCSTC